MNNNSIKFIDLFSGLGGMRLGFEQAANGMGYETKCVLTSEIKPHAIKVHNQNFKDDNNIGDITQIDAKEIPDFDFLLGGFLARLFHPQAKGMALWILGELYFLKLKEL